MDKKRMNKSTIKSTIKSSYAVITGASSGIGAEFARQLAREGYPLILVARRKERLKKLANELKEIYRKNIKDESLEPVRIITADLARTEECFRLMQELKEFPIEIFINNAGFGDCGAFLNTELSKELEMVDLNIKAVHTLTKLVLQRFAKKDHGYLLNVASSAGLIPAGPYMAAYYASKAYVASLTRAIHQELMEGGSRIYIGALCPGPVDTEFNAVANVEFALRDISAQECVRTALRGMKKRQTVIIPTITMKAAIVLGRHIPQVLYIKLAGHQQKKKISRQ